MPHGNNHTPLDRALNALHVLKSFAFMQSCKQLEDAGMLPSTKAHTPRQITAFYREYADPQIAGEIDDFFAYYERMAHVHLDVTDETTDASIRDLNARMQAAEKALTHRVAEGVLPEEILDYLRAAKVENAQMTPLSSAKILKMVRCEPELEL